MKTKNKIKAAIEKAVKAGKRMFAPQNECGYDHNNRDQIDQIARFCVLWAEYESTINANLK